MTVNEEILNRTIRHMVWTERYKTSETKRILKVLKQSNEDLIEQIAARLIKIEQRGFDLGEATTKRLNDLLAAITEQRKELAASLYKESSEGLFEFVVQETDFQARLITSAVATVGVNIDMVRPALSQLKAAVTKKPFQGRLLKDWYKDLSASSANRIRTAVMQGIIQGQTTDQIVKNTIRGTAARQFKDGLFEKSRRDVQAVTRTAINHVTARAKDDLYEANSDIIKGVQFRATLDGRTSDICIHYSNRIFKLGEPRPVLPLHFNERSQYVPYLGPSKVKGLQASQTGPVPDDLSYSDWLRKQDKAFQEEVLGVKKAKLFREGKIDADRFMDIQGKSLTLAQMKAKEPEIWNKVFKEK